MPHKMTMKQVAAQMQSPTLLTLTARAARRIRKSRVSGDDHDKLLLRRTLNQLPYLIFSSTFSNKGIHEPQQPTGLVLLSVDTGGDSCLHRRVIMTARQLPQSAMVFTGVSQRTVKIVVRCRPASGALPADGDAYCRFLLQAQRQAARYYGVCCHCEVTISEATLTHGCRMGHNEEVYVNERAELMTIVGDGDNSTEQYPLAHCDTQGNTSSDPTAADTASEHADFMACLEYTKNHPAVHGTLDGERNVLQLALLCRRSALPEEGAVQRTCLYSPWQLDETTVRSIFKNAYSRYHNGTPHRYMTPKEQIARKVQAFFERRYELRYNVMKLTEEYRPKGRDHHPWLPLSDRDLRRIAHEQMIDAGAAWAIDIEQYARSSMVPAYNPIHEFLAACGQWDHRRDYIGDMARRVTNDFAPWQQLFHRWLLAMVAQWLGKSRDYGNAMVPMLIGAQGCRKSTFCRLLLPPSLREYYIDDIKLDSAEQVERMLGRMALVNIDEYNAKTDREQAKIKRILTERDVQTRRPRSDQYLLLQRMASFIATTNEPQPLTDPTGSRRYICVEVSGTIDTVTPVNYQQLYAQAVYEIEHGEPYYLSEQEEQMVIAHNQQYMRLTAADELLSAYYEPASRSKEHFLRASDMLAHIQQQQKGGRLSMKQLLHALKVGHYEYGAIKGTRGGYAKEKEEEWE